MTPLDVVVLNGEVALQGRGCMRADLGIRAGRIVSIGQDLAGADAAETIDALGKLVLPGAVDSHFHLGIYRDISTDAASETASALAGGVTTVVSYFRTGSHYLNRTGSYREILPVLLDLTAGQARVDFGYHIAPMIAEHVEEIDWLLEQGIASFKYFLSYKELTGDEGAVNSYTLSTEPYDLGHLYEIMKAVARAGSGHPGGRVSLSVHCEQPELIRVFSRRVVQNGVLTGLAAYSAGRPPLTERLAIAEVGVLADATSCAVNLLHLSSRDALAAAIELRRSVTGLDVRAETTVNYLGLTHENYADQRAKVNPPIRSGEDRDALWSGVLQGDIDWIASDHCCCSEADKEGDLWRAVPGFGGTALLYPFLLTEGVRRGLSIERIVELVSTNPARAFGLAPRKGAIALGADADLVIVDMREAHEVTPQRLLSAQDFTPFAGMPLVGWPLRTLVRGVTAFADGRLVGEPRGEFIRRPIPPVGTLEAPLSL